MDKIKLYALQLSYRVPSAEKDVAVKAIATFTNLVAILQTNDDYLNLLYVPFKDNPAISTEHVNKSRAALRRYRDKTSDNFNILKKAAFKCFIAFQPFSSDTQVVKLNKSFVLSVSDIDKQASRFIDLFSNLESKDFPKAIVSSIDNIKKQIAQLKQIINDRILTYIQNNILARSWVDNVSEELQHKVEKKIPLSVELFNERAKKLEDDKAKNV
jgi:hypothetical protein